MKSAREITIRIPEWLYRKLADIVEAVKAEKVAGVPTISYDGDGMCHAIREDGWSIPLEYDTEEESVEMLVASYLGWYHDLWCDMADDGNVE